MIRMSAMQSITSAQFERLPEVLAEIVNCDREIGNIRRRSVCDFDEFKRLKTLRAEARAGAHAKWGYQATGRTDNTSPA